MTRPIPGAPVVAPQPPKMFRTLAIAASGLTAQRARMDVIATNIANAETTRTADGGPYKRQTIDIGAADPTHFAERLANASQLQPAEVARVAIPADALGDPSNVAAYGVNVRGVSEDQSAGTRVYQPGHPDADADGYVTYPNVRVTDEIVDLMDARRLFEANATVFSVAKTILRRSIDI